MHFYIAGKRHASGTIHATITHLYDKVPLSRSTGEAPGLGSGCGSAKPIEMER
jgi:hypothetical protein